MAYVQRPVFLFHDIKYKVGRFSVQNVEAKKFNKKNKTNNKNHKIYLFLNFLIQKNKKIKMFT